MSQSVIQANPILVHEKTSSFDALGSALSSDLGAPLLANNDSDHSTGLTTRIYSSGWGGVKAFASPRLVVGLTTMK